MAMCIHGQEYETCSFGCTLKKAEEPKCKPEEPEAGEWTRGFRTLIHTHFPSLSEELCVAAEKVCDIADRQAAELKELSDTVQINCNPPKDCNDPVVLKTYMKACFDKAMEYPK